MSAQKSLKVPQKMQKKYKAIVKLTDAVCAEHLDDEYAEYARYLTAALARKRPSPIERGHAKSWAAGVVHAIGFVNFLQDKSFEPAMSTADLWQAFGVSKSTGGNKSRDIREMFDMYQFDPNWTLPSLMDKNPMAWMVQTPEGFIMDARSLPPEVQIALGEAGIIPEQPELIASLVSQTQARRSDAQKSPRGAKCGLCGKTENLTRTPCCNQWICDDADNYQLFSYARNSCYRNHDRYTLCAYHWHEDHEGDWQTCAECRHGMETEMYVYYGTNEYNFEVLQNPPKFEPTRCTQCNKVINLGEDGYSYGPDGYTCMSCTNLRF